MRSNMILFAIGTLVLSACNNPSPSNSKMEDAVQTAREIIEDAPIPTKKYQIKAATITYENILQSGNFNISQKTVVYIEDYGIKERKDTYDDEGNVTESFFSDGQNLYLILHEKKTAFDRGKAFRGTEFKFDWDEISSEDKENGNAEKGANEMVAGKDCEVFYHSSDVGRSKFAGWNNICLLTEASGSFGESINRAVDIKEGSVSADLFKVPDGYTLKKY